MRCQPPALMGFWTVSLTFVGTSIATVLILPSAMGFSLPQTALFRISKISSNKSFVRENTFFGGLDDVPPGLDAASFFEFASVDLDPETFLVEKFDMIDASLDTNASESVFSAEGSFHRGQGKNTVSVRIYWTIPNLSAGAVILDDENNEMKQIIQAFEGIISSCWINQYESDGRIVRIPACTPEELMSVIRSLSLKEREDSETTRKSAFEEVPLLIMNDGESKINPNAIDESSLQSQVVIDDKGQVFEVFSANRNLATSIEKIATDQTIWWRTLDMGHDQNPYGDLSEVWTDQQFSAFVPSLRGDGVTFFLRNAAIRLKLFATLSRQKASQILCPFRRENPEPLVRNTMRKFPNQISLIAQRLLCLAGITFFLGVGPFRISPLTKILIDFIALCRPYLQAMMMWLLCVVVLDVAFKPILKHKWPLQNNSPAVEHLTTLSIAMQSIGIFIHAVQDCIDFLLKVPIIGLLKSLSVMTKWSQRSEKIANHTLYDRVVECLLSNGGVENHPFWLDAVIFAPVREEMIFRFAFDRIWHGIRIVGIQTAILRKYSNSLQPPWVWTNSLLFGFVHSYNWLPITDKRGDEGVDIWDNILGAFFQSTGSFLTAFFVFNPLYVRHGLSSSICAHSILNSIFVGFPLLVASLRNRKKFLN